MFEIRLFLLPISLRISWPLVFCPEYNIFVEMIILKTFRTFKSGSWKVFWEIDLRKMSKNIERLQIRAKSFENT